MRGVFRRRNDRTDDSGVGPFTLATRCAICLADNPSDVSLRTSKIASRTWPGAYLAGCSLIPDSIDVQTSSINRDARNGWGRQPPAPLPGQSVELAPDAMQTGAVAPIGGAVAGLLGSRDPPLHVLFLAFRAFDAGLYRWFLPATDCASPSTDHQDGTEYSTRGSSIAPHEATSVAMTSRRRAKLSAHPQQPPGVVADAAVQLD